MSGLFIHGIGTASPRNGIDQEKAAEYLINSFENQDPGFNRKVNAVFSRSGIKKRYTVLDSYSRDQNFLWGRQNGDVPLTKERMEVFKRSSTDLVMDSIRDLDLTDVDSLITVTCTGLMAPGLEIILSEKLHMPPSTKKLAMNFMGCYGSFHALKTAEAILKAGSASKALISSVELCSIHFQKSKEDTDILANALFGDGAASFVIEKEKSTDGSMGFELLKTGNHLFPEGNADLKWDVTNTGFEMVLSSKLPGILKTKIKTVVSDFLSTLDLRIEDIHHFAIHPGGKRILDELKEVLKVSSDQVSASYSVLEDYGNMSSTTILFVLKNLLANATKTDKDKLIFTMAFGPGLTVEMALLRFV